MPILHEEVEKIWNHFFKSGTTLARAWTLSIKSTQSRLIHLKKRAKKRYFYEVEDLEKRVNQGDLNAQKVSREIRTKLEDKELEESLL